MAAQPKPRRSRTNRLTTSSGISTGFKIDEGHVADTLPPTPKRNPKEVPASLATASFPRCRLLLRVRRLSLRWRPVPLLWVTRPSDPG